MLEKTTGLILRTHPFTETSLIVHWLTREAGRFSTLAKGARRKKSPFSGKLDLFFKLALSFHRKPHSDLHTLAEVSLLETQPHLRRDWKLLEQAAYAAFLLEKTTEADTPIAEAFDLFDQW